MSRPINMFVIYAREDKDIKLQLLKFLYPFATAFNLNIWHDDHIEAGQEWKPHIESRLSQTDVFLLLVSIDFMNSEFINKVEFKYAIQRHKENKSVVIPVIINYCPWDINSNLKDLQVLPDEGKPIDDWKTPAQAFNNIATGIRKVLSSINSRLSQQQSQEHAELSSTSSSSEQILQEQKDKQQQEEDLWLTMDDERNIDSYKEYLQKYPEGKYKTEALRAVRILGNLNNRKQENEKEEALWKIACDKNTVSSFKEYMDKTGLSLYADQANEFITKLENEHEQKQEQLSWQKASKENSLNAYDAYLQKYPEGGYAGEAMAAIENLEAIMEEDFLWKNALKENTPASYSSYLKQTRLAQHKEEAQSFIQKKAGPSQREKEEDIFWSGVRRENPLTSYAEYQKKYPDGKYLNQMHNAIKNLQVINESPPQEEYLQLEEDKKLPIGFNIFLLLITLIYGLIFINKIISHTYVIHYGIFFVLLSGLSFFVIPLILFLLFKRSKWAWILLVAENVFVIIGIAVFYAFRDSTLWYLFLPIQWPAAVMLIRLFIASFLFHPRLVRYFNVSKPEKIKTLAFSISVSVILMIIWHVLYLGGL